MTLKQLILKSIDVLDKYGDMEVVIAQDLDYYTISSVQPEGGDLDDASPCPIRVFAIEGFLKLEDEIKDNPPEV